MYAILSRSYGNAMDDPLSDILSLLKPKAYITGGFDAGGDWALSLDDLAGRIKCYAVIRGACWIGIADEEPVRVAEGDCFILPSGRTITISGNPTARPMRASKVLNPDRSGDVVTWNGGGDVYLVGSRFEVRGIHAETLLRTLPPLIQVSTRGEQAKLRWFIELMMDEVREQRPGALLMAQQLAHMMLVQALRIYLSEQSGRDIGWLAALADPRIGTAIGAIHKDPAHPWTLRSLADCAGMSRTVFARRFRDRVGETPMVYLTRWRMMLAGERLVQSGDSMAQIANSIGYASEHAFSTAFKRSMGYAPRQYARLAKSAGAQPMASRPPQTVGQGAAATGGDAVQGLETKVSARTDPG